MSVGAVMIDADVAHHEVALLNASDATRRTVVLAATAITEALRGEPKRWKRRTRIADMGVARNSTAHGHQPKLP